MKKPLCTKQLAGIALALVLVDLLFHIFTILNPEAAVIRYTSLVEMPDIPAHSITLQIIGAATILPFLGVCIYNAFTFSMSFIKSLVSAIAGGVFWIGSTYCAMFFNSLALSSAGSADAVAAMSAVNLSRSFIPSMNAIAFAMVCSALAIEMYIVKKDESASVQSEVKS